MYMVQWMEEALADLARLWIDADSNLRKLISVATNEIDRRLRKHPLDEGESRDGADRIFLWPPLGVTFEVSEQDRVLRILGVWQFRVGPKKS